MEYVINNLFRLNLIAGIFMITSLELSNWRSHHDTQLEFGKGTNLLIGRMGTGKSTILDAISFALFGTYPALDRRKISLSDILRLNENTALVKLGFFWSGKKYLISRTIERKKNNISTDAEITCDGKLIDKGTTAVSSYLEALLSTDYDLFTRAIYSEQNNIDYFLTLEPRRRKQEMDTLLGLDKFEVARVNCTSILNKVKNERTALEKNFNQQRLDELQVKISEVEAKFQELTNSIKTSAFGLEIKTTEILKKQQEFAELRKQSEKFELSNREILILNGKLQTLKKDVDGIEVKEINYDVLSPLKELDFLRLKIRGITKSAEDLSKTAGSLDAQIRIGVAQEIEGAKTKTEFEKLGGISGMNELTAKMETGQKKQHEMRVEVSSKLRNISEITNGITNLKPIDNKCPICERELDEKHAEEIRSAKKQMIETEKNEVQRMNVEIGKLDSEVKTENVIFKKMQELKSRLDNTKIVDLAPARLELEKVITEKSKLNNDLKLSEEAFEASRKRYEEVKKKAEEQERMLKKIAEIKDTEEKINNLERLLKDMNFDKTVFDIRGKELEELRINYEKEKSIIEKLRMSIENVNGVIELLKREASQLKQTKTALEKKGRIEEELAIYKNTLAHIQTKLRVELIESINAGMTEIWTIFYPYKDYTGIRINVSEKDYEMELFNGEWKSLDSIASGGERSCAALTLRVALAMVLTPNLSWLILDEPTHNLDKQAVELLSNTLQFKVPEVVAQSFVITHEEGLVGSDFASSYYLTRDKENLGPTKVDKI